MKIDQNALDSIAMSPNRENVSIFENYPQLELYYPCSKNKGADQLRSYCEDQLRSYCEADFAC